MGDQFDRFLQVFSEEVHTYIEEKHFDDLPANIPGDMEDFMKRRTNKS